ncbi:AraC family transcriptional regulator [Pseudaminobacter soli (ex Li et al. 2025)]|uniref:AraC family transcriptional regulator n=1 Tax=Pseudaminobacter soli (ex Li et al. 2025) TaxID=1295366 RepID=A0A2P7RUB6_9HYPH|nr:AraC family transcriptional regulator [Mesorhizobium soli]PSJ53762.1 AraC family transcriptional regulator [Mesorhizobium soli]
MTDPLSDVIQLLRPRAVFSKGISGAGRWAVRYAEFGQPGFCAVIEGRCRLAVDGEPAVVLEEGDFVLLPATPAFTMSGFEPTPPLRIDPKTAVPPDGEIRYGRLAGPPDVRQFGGYFSFGSPDAALLVSLLPRMIHIRGIQRLTQLVRLVGDEAARDDIGRDLILERLVDILLIEALRAAPAKAAQPGLLRGLADPRIAAVLRGMHGDVERSWTIPDLAREAGMSRSAFFDRFVRMVGVRPMQYLLAWRMAIAKNLLRSGGIGLDEVARRVGYGSASAFSTAFSRHVGLPPGRFMKRSDAQNENTCALPAGN